MFNLTQSSRLGAATVALLLIAGCGGGAVDPPPQYHVSGMVTHMGLPLADGKIYFNPKDGVSPSGYATIVYGRYDTELGGKGHTSGPHDVRIIAEPPGGIEAGWTRPFEDYETSEELPAETITLDFEIPGSKS